MKLSRDSRLVRYAYLTSEWGPPNRTNLCRLFWRTVFQTLLLLLPISLVVGYVVLWFTNRTDAIVLTLLAVLVGGSVAVGEVVNRRYPNPPSVIKEALWAVKHRVCPLIEIED